jgi:hypothetical protein
MKPIVQLVPLPSLLVDFLPNPFHICPDLALLQLQLAMQQRILKTVNNCLNSDIYSYMETAGGQSYNLYLNLDRFFNASLN